MATKPTPAKAAPKKSAKDTDVEDLLGDAPATKKPAAAKKAAPAKKEAAKPAASPLKGTKVGKAVKADDADDLLGDAPAKGSKKPASKAAEKPAKEKAARVREPIEFEDGEKEKLMKTIGKMVVKGPKSSRDLAENLGIKTRKLRQVLYSMQRAGTVVLELGGARAQGMTVSSAV